MKHLSNEDKAVEIANKEKKYYGNPQYEMRDENWSVHECYRSAMQSMQWKYEQHAKEKESFFKEYRKEILDACIYDFEQKKQQFIDKAMKVICDGCAQKAECEFNNWKTCSTKEELIKAMEE